jgi:hypothetical protein
MNALKQASTESGGRFSSEQIPLTQKPFAQFWSVVAGACCLTLATL